jgi:hypothetical protein
MGGMGGMGMGGVGMGGVGMGGGAGGAQPSALQVQQHQLHMQQQVGSVACLPVCRAALAAWLCVGAAPALLPAHASGEPARPCTASICLPVCRAAPLRRLRVGPCPRMRPKLRPCLPSLQPAGPCNAPPHPLRTSTCTCLSRALAQVQLEQWMIDPSELKFGQRIGVGSYGACAGWGQLPGRQGTSGRLWEFLPDRTWAEILSGLRPDMVAGISGQTEKIDFFFETARER